MLGSNFLIENCYFLYSEFLKLMLVETIIFKSNKYLFFIVSAIMKLGIINCVWYLSIHLG